MVDIRFEEEVMVQQHRNRNTTVAQFFIDTSFGLVKTPKQAVVAQIIVATVLFIFSSYMFALSVPASPPRAPSQALIDSPQPTQPLLQ